MRLFLVQPHSPRYQHGFMLPVCLMFSLSISLLTLASLEYALLGLRRSLNAQPLSQTCATVMLVAERLSDSDICSEDMCIYRDRLCF